MIDNSKRTQRELEKEKTRRRMRVEIDPDNYEFFPAKKQTDYYDNDVHQILPLDLNSKSRLYISRAWRYYVKT